MNDLPVIESTVLCRIMLVSLGCSRSAFNRREAIEGGWFRLRAVRGIRFWGPGVASCPRPQGRQSNRREMRRCAVGLGQTSPERAFGDGPGRSGGFDVCKALSRSCAENFGGAVDICPRRTLCPSPSTPGGAGGDRIMNEVLFMSHMVRSPAVQTAPLQGQARDLGSKASWHWWWGRFGLM